MKRLAIILIQLLLFNSNLIYSQSLTPFVISTSGGFYSNGSTQLSFTTGEMTMVQTFASTNNILTQGFQQPWDLGVYITEHPSDDFSFGVFPNPSNGNFSLVSNVRQSTLVVLKIIDVTGNVVFNRELTFDFGLNQFNFDLSQQAEGVYLMQLYVSSSKHPTIYTSKIQVIK